MIGIVKERRSDVQRNRQACGRSGSRIVRQERRVAGCESTDESTDIRPRDFANLPLAKATSAVTMMKRMITIQKNLKGLGYGE